MNKSFYVPTLAFFSNMSSREVECARTMIVGPYSMPKELWMTKRIRVLSLTDDIRFGSIRLGMRKKESSSQILDAATGKPNPSQ